MSVIVFGYIWNSFRNVISDLLYTFNFLRKLGIRVVEPKITIQAVKMQSWKYP